MATEDTSVWLVIILAVGVTCMMTALLACYICIFRDLCCPPQASQTKENILTRSRINKRRIRRDDSNTFQKYGTPEVLTLCDISQQVESMPTESENV